MKVNSNNAVLDLLSDLVKFESVTPDKQRHHTRRHDKRRRVGQVELNAQARKGLQRE